MISTSTFFASLYTALITPLLAQLQAMIGTVISTMAPIATAMAVIAVAVSGAEVAFGQKTFSGFKRDVAIAAIVAVLATSTCIIHNILAICFLLAYRIRWETPWEQQQIRRPLSTMS